MRCPHLATFVLWAVALDESLNGLNPFAYRAAKEPPKPATVPVPHHLFEALAVARHSIAHGSLVAVVPGGHIWPETWPHSWPPTTWLTFEEIPNWPGRKKKPGDCDDYVRVLQAQAVLDSVDLVVSWFDRVRSM